MNRFERLYPLKSGAKPFLNVCSRIVFQFSQRNKKAERTLRFLNFKDND